MSTEELEQIVMQYQAARKQRDAPKQMPKKKSRVRIVYH